MEKQGKPWAHVATRLPIQRPSMLSHDDLRLQLEAVEPWDRYDYALWVGADRRDQENQEHRGGTRLFQEMLRGRWYKANS